MTTREIKSEIDIDQSLAPAARVATANGVGVDLRDFDSAMVAIDAGVAAGTTPSFTFEVQESDDNVTYTAVADTDLDGTEPAITGANDEQIHLIGYKGVKRYIRVAITAVTGTSPSLPCSATVVRGHAHLRPVN